MFEQLLENARAGDLTPELALRILEDSRRPENALKLFGIASELRDKYIGRELWWTAAIEGIMPCKTRSPVLVLHLYRSRDYERRIAAQGRRSVGETRIQAPSLKRRDKSWTDTITR